jgi:hypothetical protein
MGLKEIPLLLRELARTKAIGPNDAVLLGGSKAVGLSQGSSDFDLYVVRERDRFGFSAVPDTFRVRGIAAPVELETFSFDAVQRVARSLRASDGEDIAAIRQEVLVRYSALVTATVLRDPRQKWTRTRDALGPQAYGKIVSRWHAAWARRLFAIARGSWWGGAFEVADVACRACVAQSADARLARDGEIYFSPKYRYEKATRANLGERFCEELWNLQTPDRLLTRASLRRRIARIAAWTRPWLPLSASSPVVIPARVPKARLEKTGTSFVVRRGDRVTFLDSDAAAVWARLRVSMRHDELARSVPHLSANKLADATGRLFARQLLSLPSKLGRWAQGV